MNVDVRLTDWTECGGCAAKWGATALSGLVGELPDAVDAEVLVGLAPSDDAAVYRVAADVAMVSTADFFPPLVDDPSDFGAIAAANACSDIFAMGARVTIALNLSAFPEALPREAVAAILAAAAERVVAAGGTTAGGHTIRSEEPIFGLAVQGVVHPDRILTKAGARPGDALVLSKPLGTGLVLAGGTPEEKAGAIAGMRMLNRAASEALVAAGTAVHAATDVTGFGLAGHGWEVAERSGVRVVVEGGRLPGYEGARRAAGAGVRTGGDPRNREYVAGRVDGDADEVTEALAYDPQTSGGLLAAVDPAVVDDLGEAGFVVVGHVTATDPGITLLA